MITLEASRLDRLASLRLLVTAVAGVAGLPGTASAINAPPPLQQLCAAGSWSSTGRTPCQPASVGYYVPTSNATSQTAAQPGYYVDLTGQTAPKAAPLGSYVDTVAATSAKLAPAGSYVDTLAATAAKPAPLGSYVDTLGASSAKLAPLGRYVDTVGASAAKPAPLGSYVDTLGATAAKLAQPGYYVDQTGQSAALAAPAGRFAAGLGNAVATACASGSNAYGAASACRITQEGFVGIGVTPRLDSSFGTGGTHALGAVAAGDRFAFNVFNASTDQANQSRLTGLTLLSYAFSTPGLFELTGFTPGQELAAGGGLVSFSLVALDTLPAGAFSVTLTLLTDQYADYQAAGKSFSYTFTGTNIAAVPEPGPAALLLAGLAVLALRRRLGARR